MRRREAGQGAAPAGLFRKQTSGGPRVTVRPYYEGLPLMAGRGPDERQGNRRDQGEQRFPVRPRKHGPEVEEVAAVERR